MVEHGSWNIVQDILQNILHKYSIEFFLRIYTESKKLIICLGVSLNTVVFCSSLNVLKQEGNKEVLKMGKTYLRVLRSRHNFADNSLVIHSLYSSYFKNF